MEYKPVNTCEQLENVVNDVDVKKCTSVNMDTEKHDTTCKEHCQQNDNGVTHRKGSKRLLFILFLNLPLSLVLLVSISFEFNMLLQGSTFYDPHKGHTNGVVSGCEDWQQCVIKGKRVKHTATTSYCVDKALVQFIDIILMNSYQNKKQKYVKPSPRRRKRFSRSSNEIFHLELSTQMKPEDKHFKWILVNKDDYAGNVTIQRTGKYMFYTHFTLENIKNSITHSVSRIDNIERNETELLSQSINSTNRNQIRTSHIDSVIMLNKGDTVFPKLSEMSIVFKNNSEANYWGLYFLAL